MNSQPSCPTIKCSTLSLVILLLVASLAGPAYAFNPQPEPPSDPLVYRARTTSTTKGFFNDSYASAGLLLLGPSSPQKGSGYNPIQESQVDTDVNTSPTRNFVLEKTPEGKFYGSYDSSLVVGFFNTAKENATKPNYYMASISTPPDLITAQSMLSNTDAIGKAVFRSPFPGAPKVWMPSSASATYRYFDFNPAYLRDDQNYSGAFYFLGQADVAAVPAVEVSGRSNFTFDSNLTKKVQGKTFEEAAAIIEQWLQDEGYVNANGPVE